MSARGQTPAAPPIPTKAVPTAPPQPSDPVTTKQDAANDPMLAPPPAAPKQVQSWDEAIALLRSQSPAYVTSREQVRRAEAAKRAALAPVLPGINGTGSYVHQFKTVAFSLLTPPPNTIPPSIVPGQINVVSPPPDTLAIAGQGTWNLLNARSLYAVGTANRNVDATNFSFEDDRRTIATNVVTAMLNTLAANRVSELNRVGLRAALERLGLTQTRFQFGSGTGLDVDRAQQDVAAARNLVVSGDEQLQQSRELFGSSVGSTVQVSANPQLDLESLERAVAQTCRLNDQVEERPDVKEAKVRVDIAERGVTDALLQIAPYISVIASGGYATAASLGPQTTWTFEALLTLPIYDGGLRYAARRDALAQSEQARQTLQQARINAVINSERSKREVTVSAAERDLARDQRDIARRIDERTRDGYSRGLGTSLDLITSAQNLRQAEINLAVLEFQAAQARAAAVLANAECVY